MYKKILAIGLTLMLCVGLMACSPNKDLEKTVSPEPIQNPTESVSTVTPPADVVITPQVTPAIPTDVVIDPPVTPKADVVDVITPAPQATADNEQFVYMFDDADFVEISWAYTDGHNGINITSNYGNTIYQAPIKSVCDGTVVYLVDNNKTAGNYVVVEADDGIKVGYMLMDKPTLLKVGDTVKKGETIIGYVGQSGNATGPNLLISFFETEEGDKDEFWPRTNNSLDPEKFFPDIDFITR